MRLGRPALTIVLGALLVAGASATNGVDPQIGYGPPRPGLRDAQNEPAIAVDAGAIVRGIPPSAQPLVVGANDYFDEAACGGSAGCSFFPGVGISGVYFSNDGGLNWTPQGQLKYAGFTIPGAPRPSLIVTVPRFATKLASHGDPALAFGPAPDAGGGFSWKGGSRLYYGMLAQRFRAPQTGPQLITVSTTDDLTGAASSATNAWMPPVVVSGRTPGDSFADKPAIWADNAASSGHFGSAYVCWASYRSEAEAEKYGGSPRPILFSRSADGGVTWSVPIPLAPGTGGSTRQGCAIRTDSEGGVYVVWEGSRNPKSRVNSIYMTRSFDGGASFEPAKAVATVYDVGRPDPAQGGRLTFDGVAGARTNSWPSIDIANGATSGARVRPSNTIVLAWADAAAGVNKEQALLQYSTDRGASWSKPLNAAASTPPKPYEFERPDLPAVAISPNGQNVYVVYTAFHVPWQSSPLSPRWMGGVMRTAKFGDLVTLGPSAVWTEVAPRDAVGDARGTSSVSGEERGGTSGLAAEFIGDYNTVVATDSAGYAVWVDVASAQACAAVNAYRKSIVAFPQRARKPPNLAAACSPAFGNADLHGAVMPVQR